MQSGFGGEWIIAEKNIDFFYSGSEWNQIFILFTKNQSSFHLQS